MLVTIFVSVALVSGTVFGYFLATELRNRRERAEQRTILEQTPTALLEDELTKRGTKKQSPFR